MHQPKITDISVLELKSRLDRGEEIVFLDVREPAEAETARIPGAKLFPLSQAASRLGELEPYQSKTIVAHCHHGFRSRKFLEFLGTRGFESLVNVAGGIDDWSLKVDPGVPRY